MTLETVHSDAYEAWNKRDFNRMRSMFHRDYIYTGPDGTEKPGVESSMAVAELFANGFPDARVVVDRVFTSDGAAIAECTGTGTHGGDFLGIAPTNRPVTLKMCNIIEMRDGLIYREREYFDMATVLTQIGAMPAKAARA
jgi:steroid delta-isomerase-like uncharacterized protein